MDKKFYETCPLFFLQKKLYTQVNCEFKTLHEILIIIFVAMSMCELWTSKIFNKQFGTKEMFDLTVVWLNQVFGSFK